MLAGVYQLLKLDLLEIFTLVPLSLRAAYIGYLMLRLRGCENKDADQLHGYRVTDLHLRLQSWFSHGAVHLIKSSNCNTC